MSYALSASFKVQIQIGDTYSTNLSTTILHYPLLLNKWELGKHQCTSKCIWHVQKNKRPQPSIFALLHAKKQYHRLFIQPWVWHQSIAFINI